MIKVLIVDDNLQYIKNILNTTINKFSEIHIEYIATTAKEAINVISNNQIDLIFLDLNLPDENGIYIIDQIKYLNNIKTNIIKATNAIKNGDNLTPKFVVSNILTKIISNY